MNKRVVVIGGGITGLTALRQIRQRSPGTEAILLEAAPRLGGKKSLRLIFGSTD